MLTYCLSSKKHTYNFSPKKIKMTNKVIRQASKCDEFVAKKSFEKKSLAKILLILDRYF